MFTHWLIHSLAPIYIQTRSSKGVAQGFIDNNSTYTLCAWGQRGRDERQTRDSMCEVSRRANYYNLFTIIMRNSSSHALQFTIIIVFRTSSARCTDFHKGLYELVGYNQHWREICEKRRTLKSDIGLSQVGFWSGLEFCKMHKSINFVHSRIGESIPYPL